MNAMCSPNCSDGAREPAAQSDAAAAGWDALDVPATELHGVGAAAAAKLERLGIATLGDLLLHLPFRYQDRTRSVPLGALRVGSECLVTAEVMQADIAYGRRRSLFATLRDATGTLGIRLFHFHAGQRKAMAPGLWMRCFGEVRAGPSGLEMVHPDYRLFAEQPPPVEPSLTPVYRATQGLASARLAPWIAAALERCADVPFSVLAADDAESEESSTPQFAALLDALRYLHAPPDADAERLAAARARVALDELIGHYLVLKRRQRLAGSQATAALPPQRQLGRELLSLLGFRLTRAQANAIRDILEDLAGERPMMRLLQGDVGAGKTVVAAFAAVRAAENGGQTAIMAPTEILAEQHFETMSAWLAPLGIGVGLLTGRQSAAARRARLEALREGQDLVAVGTHALFQSGVEFQRLVLAIIDEQHRFGVHQRMQLRDKGRLPHQLVMTATPIPRTLTMALYADMDASTINELPPGRIPVRTRLVAMPRRREVIDRVARLCAGGQQAYWVCTMIEDDAESPQNAAEAIHRELAEALPEALRLGLVHGRLPPEEKAAAMAAFKSGETQVLVATTVIEVGVDVPNATLMVIDNAERLGLAQLHQLRGRVGRGSAASTCVLLYDEPLSKVARERLRILRETADGFKIAEKDLELRGPGDMLGTRQTGEQTFKLADLTADRALVPRAVAIGDRLLAGDARTADRIVATWGQRGARYASV